MSSPPQLHSTSELYLLSVTNNEYTNTSLIPILVPDYDVTFTLYLGLRLFAEKLLNCLFVHRIILYTLC